LAGLENPDRKPVEPCIGRGARVPHQTDCEWVSFQRRINPQGTAMAPLQ